MLAPTPHASASGAPTTTPTAGAVASATASAMATASASAIASPSPAPIPTSSPTNVPTATPTPTASPTVSPTPSTTPTATPGPLTASPSSLAFSGTGQTQNVTIGDPGFSGTYQVTGCYGIVSYGAVSSGVLAVTSTATGQCAIIVGDSFNETTISVTVTTLSVPIQ